MRADAQLAARSALAILEGDYLAALRSWRVTERGPLGRKQSLFAAGGKKMQVCFIRYKRLWPTSPGQRTI